jgi:hypothetical protein
MKLIQVTLFIALSAVMQFANASTGSAAAKPCPYRQGGNIQTSRQNDSLKVAALTTRSSQQAPATTAQSSAVRDAQPRQ